jgi:DNA-binding protein HU-beta/integration host factor subunit beta
MTTTVNKKELAAHIAKQTGITQPVAREIVQQVFDSITDVLAESGRLELRDFGVFEVKRRAAHKARNPLTGETVQVPAKNFVTFKPGKAMNEKVQLHRQKKQGKRN